MTVHAHGLAVGNLVFVDVNANGVADAGEGRGGVEVRVYAAGDDPALATPAAKAVSDPDGFYMVPGLSAGDYFAHVPASEFVDGGTLARHSAMAVSAAGDDVVGQDGLPGGNPSISGVSTAVFSLSLGNEAVETGFQAAADDDADADGDLTIDFGFVPPPVGVGNLVFFDRNGNGRADSGEGIAGVRVALHSGVDDSLLETQITDSEGKFLFTDVRQGSYRLRIDSAEFGVGRPLYRMKSLAGVSVGDDDAGEDGEDALDAAVTGVATAVFALNPGQLPIGEPGAGNEMDDGRDADVDLTRDFGFIDLSELPGTFEQWKVAHELDNGTADHDGDGLSDLVEYALMGDPKSGARPSHFRIEPSAVAGSYDVKYRRRRGGLGDVQFLLQATPTPGNRASWQLITGAPVIEIAADGTETVTHANLTGTPALASAAIGAVRLAIVHNGQTTVIEPVLGWHKRTFQTGNNTLGLAFAGETVFSGVVSGFYGAAAEFSEPVATWFTPGADYYLEVVSGPIAGHRLEIDEAASMGTTLALQPAHTRSTTLNVSTGLVGSQVIVRRHRTLGEVLPPAAFKATRSPATADAVNFYNASQARWESFWLYAAAGGAHWVNQSDVDLISANGRVIDPAEGLFVRCRTAPAAHAHAGEVRRGAFAMPLKAGNNWIASPWAVVSTFNQRLMNQTQGFVPSANPTLADRVQIWGGDDVPSQATYTQFIYVKLGADAWWARSSDTSLADVGNEPAFAPGRACFIQARTARPNWVMPSPFPPD